MTRNPATGTWKARACGSGALLCAVHCLAAPALAVIAPALVLPVVEWTVAVVFAALGIALLAGGAGPRSRRTLLVGALGIGLWLGSHAAVPAAEPWLAASGGLLLFLSLRPRRPSTPVPCP